MSDQPKKFKKWLYAVLVALGVGGYPAAKLAGCDSGFVDDAKTITVAAPTAADPKATKQIPNPTYGECLEFDK